MFGSMTFVARPSGNGATLLDAARGIAAQLTPGSPIGAVDTVQTYLTARLVERRTYVTALCAFAITAALLAAIALYGVMVYDVQARSGEIAVRTALGARPAQLVVAIGRPAGAIVAAGVIAGLAGAIAFARFLGPQLWGIAPFDPALFAIVSLALLALTVATCSVPLRHAMSLNLATRLRSD
jgi:ABC-type antimicrobial peptide transport system permease subunit